MMRSRPDFFPLLYYKFEMPSTVLEVLSEVALASRPDQFDLLCDQVKFRGDLLDFSPPLVRINLAFEDLLVICFLHLV